MAIINTRTRQDLDATTRRLAEVQTARDAVEQALELTRGQNQKLEAGLKKMHEVQELIVDDMLSIKTIAQSYKGNEYQSYEKAVKAISEKYNGQSEWGCLQTGTSVDLRAAFILGDGVKVVHSTDEKEEAQAELDWVKDFFEFNGLDGEMAQELAKEAEIEGKLAVRLAWEDREKFRSRPGMVTVRFISWSSRRYKVKADPDDYLWYRNLSWETKGTEWEAGNLGEAEFCYAKFGGRMNDPNQAQPKVMKCLTQIDRLDMALRDLREINHLFSAPTADFECATPQQATALLDFIREKNWKIGKAIAHVGSFKLVSPSTEGIESLIREIELLVKMISGTTGIPIHYYGLLDLLKNRATGDNTRELVMAATTKERAIYQAFFEELVEKGMAMYNDKAGLDQKSAAKRLDPQKLRIEIPLISQDHWKNLELVLIPAALGGIVSKEFVAESIPGVNIDIEEKRRQKAEAKAVKDAAAELQKIKASQGQTNPARANEVRPAGGGREN